MSLSEHLHRNLESVRARMAAACARSGRCVGSVQLVAVTKYARLEAIRELLALGMVQLGENRPQQLVERAEQLPQARWHLIGHLQRNKVRAVLPYVSLVHSVDSLRLLERIDEVSKELGQVTPVLLELNVSGEAAKQGFSVAAFRDCWPSMQKLEHVSVEGLMTMAPLCDDPEAARPVFRRLRELRGEVTQTTSRFPLPHLSMGMSGDFEVAIEEGATLVRLGSVLFEGVGQ